MVTKQQIIERVADDAIEFISLQFTDILGVVRSQWRLIGLLALTFALLGFLYGSSRPQEYQSTASVVVDDPQGSTLFGVDNSTRPERYLETHAEVEFSHGVCDRCLEEHYADMLDLEFTVEDTQLEVLGNQVVDRP